jgi:chemosensory pili system protein ChpA (sensor histidine kinase/response regulator)
VGILEAAREHVKQKQLAAAAQAELAAAAAEAAAAEAAAAEAAAAEAGGAETAGAVELVGEATEALPSAGEEHE